MMRWMELNNPGPAGFLVLAVVAWTAVACGPGTVYLPNQPGHQNSDLSGLDTRRAWVEGHPDLSPEIRDAILQGVFLEGMTAEEVEVISNPQRKGTFANGYWRHSKTGDEVRYEWYLSAQRWPFHDGEHRLVCQLTLVDKVVTHVEYCPPDAPEPPGGAVDSTATSGVPAGDGGS